MAAILNFYSRTRSASATSGTEITEIARSLIGAHSIIFGERSYNPRICESQTSKILVPDLTLADCARV